MNQGGWGLKDFIFIVGVLFIALIIATVLYQTTFSGLFKGKSDYQKKTYDMLEAELKAGAQDYQNNHFQGNINSTIVMILPYKMLRENADVGVLRDIKSGKECDGYVKFIQNGAQISYVPYLKCENYTTKNFNNDYIK